MLTIKIFINLNKIMVFCAITFADYLMVQKINRKNKEHKRPISFHRNFQVRVLSALWVGGNPSFAK